MKIALIDEMPDDLIQLTQIKRSVQPADTGKAPDSQCAVVALPGPLGLGPEDLAHELRYEDIVDLLACFMQNVQKEVCVGSTRWTFYSDGSSSVREVSGES